MSKLSHQWTTTLAACGATAELSQAALSELIARYAEPHRHYHSLDHIAAVLDVLAAVGSSEPVLFPAAWYHDAIYDTGAVDNEERSATLGSRRAWLSGCPARGGSAWIRTEPAGAKRPGRAYST